MGILVRSVKEIRKVEIDSKKTFLILNKDKFYFEGIMMIINKEIDYNSIYLNIDELNSLVKLNCSIEKIKYLNCRVNFKTDARPISTIIVIKEKQNDKLYDISERKSLSVVYYPQVKYIFPNTFSINKQNNISIITDIIANNTLAKFSFNCDIIDSFSNDTLIKGVIIYQNDNIFICHFSPLDIYHNIKLKVSLIYKDKYININLIDIYPVINDDIVDHYPKVYVNNKNDEINFVFSRLNKSVLFFHRKTIEKKILLTLSEWKNDYSVIVNGDYYSFYEDDFVISNRIGDVLKKYFSSNTPSGQIRYLPLHARETVDSCSSVSSAIWRSTKGRRAEGPLSKKASWCARIARATFSSVFSRCSILCRSSRASVSRPFQSCIVSLSLLWTTAWA